MKKVIFICAGFFLLLVCSWIGIRIFGIFNTYRNVSSANEPNIAINQIVMASNLKEAKKGSLIVVKVDGVPCIYRLCAVEGNQIEIKKGDAYLNGKIMLQNYDTKHNYNFSNKVYDELISSGKIKVGESVYTLADELHLELVDAEAKKAGIYQNKQVAMLAYVMKISRNNGRTDGMQIISAQCWFQKTVFSCLGITGTMQETPDILVLLKKAIYLV